jgi:uncharacterized protein YbjT (DUF2867 family)
MKKSILLLGATGLIGGYCLKFLCEDDHYERIVVLTRRALPGHLKHPKVEHHIIDFDRPETYSRFVNTDHLICALGATMKKAGSKESFFTADHTYPLEFAKMALKNGAEHFLIVTACLSSAKSPFFLTRVKGQLEDALFVLEYGSISIFRPSMLLGKRDEFRLGEEVAKSLEKIISFFLPKKYKPIQGRAVAGAMVKKAVENLPGIHIYESGDIQKMFDGLQENNS